MGRARWFDAAPGAEVVGVWQALTVWAALLVVRHPAGGSLPDPVLGAATAAGAGFLHGLLLVRPLAALGRWGAGRSGWPEPAVVAVLAGPVSAPAAALACWWLGYPEPGFGAVWAGTAGLVVVPLLVGACLRARPVPVGTLWSRGAAAAGTAVGVVAMAGALAELWQ
ncbi:hypothetical protein ABZZ17_17630 [Streptomyces sp. NPDC006512]|uniref:hypothetical protein n=1 Tax=Streptomyces sp. NPDC006512 TaxID=3154307 RepID=UPI0033BDCC41